MTTRHSLRTISLVLAIAICAAPLPAGAAGTPDQNCRAAKLKAAGKYASSLLGCHSKAARDGSTIAADCLSKAAGKLAASFDGADSKVDEACNGLESSTIGDVHALADAVVTAAPPLAGGGKCPSSIDKAAGKLASSELKAWAKFVTGGDAAKRDAAIDKARIVLTAKIGKAEQGDGCMGTAQAAAVQAAVANGILPLLACIAGTELCVEHEEVAGAGETVTTDDGTGPDPEVPISASVQTPNAGTVVLRIVESALPPPSGYGILGQEVEVSAPDASAAVPLVLTFTIDASLLPVDPFTVTLTRNGVVVADCSGAPDVASPDPCVQSRLLLGSGDLQITALSSQASVWTPVVALGPTTTTTTTTITTSTTLPLAGDYSMRWQMRADKVGSDVASELDIGWAGYTHDIDPIDGSAMRFRLDCPSAAPPFYGDCTVTGFDPAESNCRCSNSSATVCDEPYASDADDCGGATCTCYTRPPLPASASGTPVCMVGTASTNASGSWNPDTGSGEVTLNEVIKLHLGGSVAQPCPVCVGDPTPNDGVRGGTCDIGETPGAACDANGSDPTYPAPGGGASSLDCLPSQSSNISGLGMKFPHAETTSVVSLPSGIPCAGNTSENCPCAACSSNTTVGCSSDAQCLSELGESCSLDPAESCETNADCAAVDEGNCHPSLLRCQGAFDVDCTTNADCASVDVGPCVAPTCTATGSGGSNVHPNGCGGTCDVGLDGEAQCSDPSGSFCDGLVEEDGKPVMVCSSNTDCQNQAAGNCTLAGTRGCFPPTITATGIADPDSPRTVAALCVGPISNSSANGASGLPGPARLRSDWTVTYE